MSMSDENKKKFFKLCRSLFLTCLNGRTYVYSKLCSEGLAFSFTATQIIKHYYEKLIIVSLPFQGFHGIA